MDNTNSTEQLKSRAAADISQESQSTQKRARSDSSSDPPAKRPMRSSPSDSRVEGGPPLMPMDFAEPKEAPPKEPAKEDPKATTRLVPPTAPAPAPVPPRGAKVSSPALNPKPTSVSTPLQPRTSTRAGSNNKKATVAYKGLRHFSMMVCKKVEEKGETTYNVVADELVKQVMEVRKREEPNGKFDEKNIRRRVYDSINVLLAMDIIAKDKKQITWKGLPTTAHHDLQLLEREEEARKKQVEAKRKSLQEILLQQICFRNLVTHNKEREAETIHAEKVPMPFIVVNTHKEAIIHCNMAPDLTNVMFEFDRSFETNDDNAILTRLGMHKTSVPTLREMVPEDMVTYCQEHGLLDSVLGESDTKTPAVFGLTSEGSNKGQYFRAIH